jgi:hypothetical protein
MIDLAEALVLAPKLMSTRTVCLSVKWGDEVIVDLYVSGRNWSKIIQGKNVALRGRGYRYDGDDGTRDGAEPVPSERGAQE